MPELPPLPQDTLLGFFIASDDVERSRRFCAEVVGGRELFSGTSAQFLTPPTQHEYKTRWYIRDPDGYLIEVGQTTDPDGDWSPAQWPSGTSAEAAG